MKSKQITTMAGKTNRRNNQQGPSPNNRARKRTPNQTTPVRQNLVRDNSIEQNISSGANTPPRANLSSGGSNAPSPAIEPRELQALLEAAVPRGDDMSDTEALDESSRVQVPTVSEDVTQTGTTQRITNPYQQNRNAGRGSSGNSGGRLGNSGGRSGNAGAGRGSSHTSIRRQGQQQAPTAVSESKEDDFAGSAAAAVLEHKEEETGGVEETKEEVEEMVVDDEEDEDDVGPLEVPAPVKPKPIK